MTEANILSSIVAIMSRNRVHVTKISIINMFACIKQALNLFVNLLFSPHPALGRDLSGICQYKQLR